MIEAADVKKLAVMQHNLIFQGIDFLVPKRKLSSSRWEINQYLPISLCEQLSRNVGIDYG
jgi:hypothetical protein